MCRGNMVVAVCMISVELGKESEIRRKLSTFEGVRDLIHLFGEYDFIAIIEAEDLKQVNTLVDNIRTIKGITSTRTVIGAEA